MRIEAGLEKAPQAIVNYAKSVTQLDEAEGVLARGTDAAIEGAEQAVTSAAAEPIWTGVARQSSKLLVGAGTTAGVVGALLIPTNLLSQSKCGDQVCRVKKSKTQTPTASKKKPDDSR